MHFTRRRFWLAFFAFAALLFSEEIRINQATRIPSSVIELNDKFLDVMDSGLWFVEFYAPWCAHCKKLMPVWEHMAHALADKQSPIRVGKLDCTRFSSVASSLRIHGYPTVIFFRNGVQIPYEGERRKEELVKFAEKCAGPVVDRIESQAKLAELRKSSDREPFFVFFDPSKRAEEEHSREMALWRQYENASESLFTEVRFYEVLERRVLPEKMRAGNGTCVLAFKDRDHWTAFELGDGEVSGAGGEQMPLLAWIGRERWPMLPQITASNIHSIAESTGKMLVLVPMDPVDRLNTSTESGRFFDMVRRTTTEMRDKYREELQPYFQFGWLDGTQIAKGIVMGELAVPNLVVFNLSSYEFYMSDDRPDQMTAQSLLLFLQSVRNGEVPPQGGRAWITRLRRMFYELTSNLYDMFQHQPILTVCLFGVPLAFFSIITYSICSVDFSVERDEIYPEDEDDEGHVDDGEQSEDEEDFDHVRPEALEGGDDHEKAD